MWPKLVLLFITGCSVHVSLSPPQPQAPSKQLAGPRTFFERIVRHITMLTKSLTWLFVAIDAFVTVSYATAPHTASPIPFCPRPAGETSLHLLSLSRLMIIGAVSALAGALLRVWCYHTLGRLFTFEVSIMPAHTLITSGPYSIVRHPSYTGIHLTLTGVTAVLGAYSAWPRACGILRPLTSVSITAIPVVSIAWIVATLWCIKCAYAMASTFRRGPHEDEQLRKHFGDEWEAYAVQTPYRMVPYLF